VIAEELVKPKAAFKGADGEVRHVIMLHKLGRGYGVSWDSVPLDADYWRGVVAGDDKARPNGYMTMRAFQKWVSEQVQPKEQP
jgi:hypothetical protein